jgi:hypothetical protein
MVSTNCSCLGPIIDVQMKSKVIQKEKFMMIQIRPVLLVLQDVYKLYSYFRQYFIELPFHDAYLFALIHLIPANYRSRLQSFFFEMCKEIWELNKRDIILGFASVFLFLKSYASCLVGELSQLCYKGVLRTIALASTDGLSTWRVGFLMTFQPVIVPVGRIALGRIFNVVGSIIDRYIDLSLSSQFNTTIPMETGLFIESRLTYTFSYPNYIFILDTIININLISLEYNGNQQLNDNELPASYRLDFLYCLLLSEFNITKLDT